MHGMINVLNRTYYKIFYPKGYNKVFSLYELKCNRIIKLFVEYLFMHHDFCEDIIQRDIDELINEIKEITKDFGITYKDITSYEGLDLFVDYLIMEKISIYENSKIISLIFDNIKNILHSLIDKNERISTLKKSILE